MNSPCKECKRRKPGCHNVNTCEKWRQYVELMQKKRADTAQNREVSMDWEQHLRRRGRKNELSQK